MTVGAVESIASTLGRAPPEPALLPGCKDWALHVPAAAVDAKDADTPDSWVPRDPRIVRLTGRHPLNCEPRMEDLMGCGFITPPSIHYVRNHGAVPKLEWGTHRIELGGLVERPLTISMDDLVSMPSVTLPVTLVCAGNRRKEENMLKKSIGFNWGPCAVSTSHWTGVRLGDLLRRAGVAPGARYVSFRGPTGELPKGEDGSYGTSLRLPYALDDSNDVLIAYKQNGRWLTPDHGFPVRMLIPGFIGGRMVKWLSEITLTEEESSNHYHYMDNRVLPPHVDEELAKKEGWWYRPDFIINELNINSAVARPWQDEVLPLASDTPYTMAGYAYSGGGRKVIRVEVSLDDGETWLPADIKCYETPNAYGKYWCWVHWTLQTSTFQFTRCKEVLLRAWDSSMNGQPATMTWNLMGMMNNCYYRIKVHTQVDEKGNLGLRFQHPAPVPPGDLGHVGWREEENLARQGAAPPAAVAARPAATAAAGGGPRLISMEEVELHASEESAWFVHEGKVYDATPFLADHPGGAESILISAGMDATDEFNGIHSSKAKAMLADYYIGELASAEQVAAAAASSSSNGAPANGHAATNGHANGAAPANGAAATNGAAPANSAAAEAGGELVALNPRKKLAVPLIERRELSHNTRLFRFGLPSPEHRFGLPTGKHVFLYAPIGGENVMRAYTPTSRDEDLGYFDLVIKVYRANEHPNFPAGGKMSQHLDSLAVGDTVEVKGPVGHFVYEGRGTFSLNGKKGEPPVCLLVCVCGCVWVCVGEFTSLGGRYERCSAVCPGTKN
ncbi:nitrate reductase [Raphidocelis subcapitata]|uniref:Nitrate reductase [NADH] n=1 Tax=Raphidocelis subcapitata TaxID=307507 RepID=A0A2V0NKK5_9CHLO|nr:nitrate reductase [Raphidocelis subcapitata]|eukprot:GBF87848.1 nitrate reductase [Raphidocelis subcapitata]